MPTCSKRAAEVESIMVRWPTAVRICLLVPCAAVAGMTTGSAQGRRPVGRQAVAVCASADQGSILSLLSAARSVRLVEADSAPIVSSVPGVAIGRRGMVAIADDRDGNVKLFDASGRYVRTLGRRGGGPGEFRAPLGVAFVGDSTLLIADDFNRRWSLLTVSGALVRQSTLRVARPAAIVVTPDAFAVAGYGLRDSTILLLDWLSAAGDSLGLSTPIPRAYVENRMLLGGPVRAASDGTDSTVFVAWHYGDVLMIANGRTGPVRTVPLPSTGGFVSAREVVARPPSGVSPSLALAQSSSAIIGLAVSSRLVTVLYVLPGPALGLRATRYHVLTRDLRPVATGLTGPRLLFGRGDTLIAQFPADSVEGSGIRLTWYVPCGPPRD